LVGPDDIWATAYEDSRHKGRVTSSSTSYLSSLPNGNLHRQTRHSSYSSRPVYIAPPQPGTALIGHAYRPADYASQAYKAYPSGAGHQRVTTIDLPAPNRTYYQPPGGVTSAQPVSRSWLYAPPYDVRGDYVASSRHADLISNYASPAGMESRVYIHN
jgi:hypothetical protein